MKSTGKRSFLFFSVFCALAVAACNHSNAVNKQPGTSANAIRSSKSEPPAALPVNNSKVRADLDMAKKEGKAVFVVVTAPGITETDKATKIAKGANALYKKSAIVLLDRDDAANSQLVAEWRLAGAPLPLLLVISPKGLPTGGYTLSEATAENIAALVPTPKLEELQAVISSNKSAFVVVTKKSYSDRAETLQACKEAVAILKNNAAIIEVDFDDPNETGFIEKLEVEKASKETWTQVINTKGQIVGTSTGLPDAAKLAAAAIAPAQSGCCPGGAGSSGCVK